jgi:CO dehydrogenase/acetyl-CoA synthase delta subunit
METVTAPVEATRIGPGEYVLPVRKVETGLEFAFRGTTYLVIGEPITVGWRSVMVRIRETAGRHVGNEFGAYLHARD